MIFLGRGASFLWTLFALFFHEAAHCIVAGLRGYRLNELVLLPYGAALYGEERIDGKSMIYIAVAGPAANVMLALIVMALWWVFPTLKETLDVFFWANVTLAVFNVLPAFPLDGSRIALGLSKNKLRALKVLKGIGVVVSAVCMILFIVSAFFKINFSLGIISIFLFIGAKIGSEKESYSHVASRLSKDYYVGVTERTVKVAKDTPLLNVLRLMNEKSELKLKIDGTELELNESEIENVMTEFPLTTTIGEALGIASDENASNKSACSDKIYGIKSMLINVKAAANNKKFRQKGNKRVRLLGKIK